MVTIWMLFLSCTHVQTGVKDDFKVYRFFDSFVNCERFGIRADLGHCQAVCVQGTSVMEKIRIIPLPPKKKVPHK